ncbi:MAG: hypothetical protein L3J08_08430 [Flavobacteriaceae bacterium]|nr:hypothetical protein [Flavobacteriaceae bacterium]
MKNGFKIGNCSCILPMEGWDSTDDGKPTEHTYRRWKNFRMLSIRFLFIEVWSY